MGLLGRCLRLVGRTRTAKIAKDLLLFAILTLLFLILLETFLNGESRKEGEPTKGLIKEQIKESTIKEKVKGSIKEHFVPDTEVIRIGQSQRKVEDRSVIHKRRSTDNYNGNIVSHRQIYKTTILPIIKPIPRQKTNPDHLHKKEIPRIHGYNTTSNRNAKTGVKSQNQRQKLLPDIDIAQASKPKVQGNPGAKWEYVRNRVRKGGPPAVGQAAPQPGVVNEAPLNLRRFRPIQRKVDFHDLPVSRAPRPTSGEPWPFPQVMRRNNSSTYVIDADNTLFYVMATTCDVIEKAIERHKSLLKDLHSKLSRSKRAEIAGSDWMILRGIEVSVYKCERYPSLDSDESYELYTTGNNTLVLRAPEVWGALMGLETMSQLVTSSRGHLVLRQTYIKDFPRFKHRGIMLDTARHYLSKDVIMKNLDAMAMNKLNVFHWHLVDDQSFPYQSKVFPQLSAKGAFSRNLVYTQDDIKTIVEHARLRGIRVIPEIDTPGHVQSWLGLTEVLTPCGGGRYYGPVDPSRNVTYERLTALLGEVFGLFPDTSMHLGGDECSYFCWSRNKNITAFMEQHNMKENYQKLFNYYITRLQKELKKKLQNQGLHSIFWQEVFDEGVKLSDDVIVHIWKDDYTVKLAEATAAGYKVLLSSCWYLNYISYGTDWHKYYMCDPHAFTGSRQQKDRVLGGEACMWGEYVDDLNLLNDLWPRASAVAERLWSAQFRSNPYIAEGRFEENRCRMIRRGIPAKAIGGPGPPCSKFPGTTG